MIRNEVAADYCFLRDHPTGESVSVLVARDRRSGLCIGHAVPAKGGAIDWVSQQFARDIRKCGYHGRVVLKGDSELALQDLFNQVARARRLGDSYRGHASQFKPGEWFC